MFRCATGHAWFLTMAAVALICSGCGKVPTWSEITGKSKTAEDGDKTNAASGTAQVPDSSQMAQTPGQPSASAADANPGANSVQTPTASGLKALIVQRYGSLDKCQLLNLSGSNPVPVSMLKELHDLPQLEHLLLSGRSLDSDSMQAIGDLKKLKGLYLEEAKFNPFDLERLGAMEGLRVLNVSRTQVSDRTLELIKHLELDVLQVQSCSEVHGGWFTGKGRDKWFGGGLKMIDADKSRFGDGGFVYINGSADVEIVMATNAGVEDGRLTGLRGCKNIRVLSLRENGISDLGTKELMKLQNLELVDLNAENLSDTTLSWLKGLKKLKRICPGGRFSEQAMQFLRTKFNPNVTFGEIGTFEQAAGLTAIRAVEPLVQ